VDIKQKIRDHCVGTICFPWIKNLIIDYVIHNFCISCVPDLFSAISLKLCDNGNVVCGDSQARSLFLSYIYIYIYIYDNQLGPMHTLEYFSFVVTIPHIMSC
jgi:uncharacterized protein YuzB (UPF0349 family)